MLPHVLRLTPDFSRLNMSHAVADLSFGPHIPGSPPNPRAGVARGDDGRTGTWRYFARVVPVSDARAGARHLSSHQYSLGEHFEALRPATPAIPSVSLAYDMAPLAVTLESEWAGWPHALLRLVAVGGGVRALAAFLDRVAHVVG